MSRISELILLSVALFISRSNAQDIPPTITLGLQQEEYYRDGFKVAMRVMAEGSPTPAFEWFKDGVSLTYTGSITPPNPALEGNGTIVFTQFSASDVGYYQCFARNDWGATMTDVTLAQLATIADFDPNLPVVDHSVPLNSFVTLTCNPPSSPPGSIYSWSYNTTSNPEQTTVITSKRIQINKQNGDLVFSTVTSLDTGRLYRCGVYSELAATSKYGALARIIQTGPNTVIGVPQLLFSSPNQMTALVGEQTILQCFFSGSGEGTGNQIGYTWTYNGGTRLPSGWVPHDTELRSPSSGPVYENAGTYVCTARNANGAMTVAIELTVEAAPDFGALENQPHDMNVTDGETVSILCAAEATPAADIQWFKDTVPFDATSLPPKFSLSDDMTNLTIADICKNCSDGTFDLMSIQCNVTNIHGHTFAQGYVNILMATVIESDGVEIIWEPNKVYTFECMATCDETTPCSVEWSFGGAPIDPDDSALVVDDAGTLTIDTTNDPDAGQARIGDYTCMVTNGYSEAEITSSITAVPVAVASLWWVGLLVALLVLLLLLLVLLCCFFCYCREGKSYPVDENERKNGNDPVKELRDTGMQHYIQTTYAPGPTAFTNDIHFIDTYHPSVLGAEPDYVPAAVMPVPAPRTTVSIGGQQPRLVLYDADSIAKPSRSASPGEVFFVNSGAEVGVGGDNIWSVPTYDASRLTEV